MFRALRWSSAFVPTRRRRTSFRSRRSVVALLVASLRSGAVAPGHHQGHQAGPQYGLESRPTLGWAGSPQETVRLGGVGLSGTVASLVVAVPCVTRRVTGRFVRALGMICPRVCGGAGLAPAAGLIRSLSAFSA